MTIKNTALISACLMGFNCRYNNKNCLSTYIDIFLKKHYLIPVCPEQLGGLATPRDKSEIILGNGFDVISGKSEVITKKRINVTENFIRGGKEVLRFVKSYNIKIAYFKEKSPSCGVKRIYNNNILVKGVGVTTAFLLQHGIEVFGVDV